MLLGSEKEPWFLFYDCFVIAIAVNLWSFFSKLPWVLVGSWKYWLSTSLIDWTVFDLMSASSIFPIYAVSCSISPESLRISSSWALRGFLTAEISDSGFIWTESCASSGCFNYFEKLLCPVSSRLSFFRDYSLTWILLLSSIAYFSSVLSRDSSIIGLPFSADVW